MEVKPLISPQELASLSQEPVVIIDTRAPEEYAVSHIPGAVNLREMFTYLATSTSEGLAGLRSQFVKLLSAAGISGTERIVIYEDALNTGYGQSCRGYFLLKYFGCPQVSVLHGGYQAWLAAGLPTTTEVLVTENKTFTLSIDSSIMVTTAQMLQALDNPAIIKLDVRDADEWRGESSSPYGVDFCPRKGRIPGAVWIEWYQMMEPSSEIPMFRPTDEIMAICQEVSITPDSTVYIYCFKGSRASNTLIALKEAGIKDVRNYFASWNEWSRDPSLPIETGEPSDRKIPALV
ncbi:sulfurtransferase [Gloeocapsopsis dulcis]|uniref:thiosulfate sulfurtransferase n=1 Tax=Gloeocapsopsis dulcis AAB1 = 1H9 TaxID=1433147 RepID=A0A6N8G0R5_9CHRO|nr:sulfurtransferase [Gloeocapsopsis dulcis]MUL37957.1 sulfurtransferase [Gloeocapsopsis dulcis AAB1 = 1H9]WNN87350.1 sulfurtransferase [Gloeocapsopsis dulcis]